jgi:hypothetical protein
MVFYNTSVRFDLDKIRIGLLNWEKIILTEEFVTNYIHDIQNICDNLDTKFYHASAVYPIHKLYGSKVYPYKRNKQTTWYIIYNLDKHGNVFINKIMSNYQTK